MTPLSWRHWSTRTRLLAITLAPLVVLCLALVWLSYLSRQDEVRAELAERGTLLARVLADSSEYAVVSGQYDELRRSVRGVLQADPAIVEVALLDAQRRELLRLAGQARGQPERRYYEAPVVKRLVWLNMRAQDGRVVFGAANGAPPPAFETVGYLRVRMSADALLARQAARFRLELLAVTAGLLLCGALAWRLSEGFDTSLQASIAALREADAEKRRLLRRLNTAVEEERQSIALEIHDELNAALIAARLESQRIATLAATVEPADVAEDIAARARSITQTTLGLYNSGRALVRRLRPEVLDMLGLQGAIEEMVRQMDASHADCRFTCRVEGEFAGLEPELAISIYRIVQEALSNVVKHARARHAAVLLARRDGAVTIDVRDDGIGYAATSTDGVGIAGMRERVHAASGSFTIDSDGGGTRIAIRLPLA
ncbi:two-component system sensor histidine kinase UhpB [Pseudoduganella flava]|uniref:Oxygen sensor histidine kinase NreB n=1 Tax=Pseudoduganella flava TaxID=871742 RepID=A0A562PTE2_9BURK|nr:sensor histidine kinase [Pseudoduganella flava]QGZ39031.1 sensor histidine kinase [Pseudoduganella flava]TWI47704.1 two-component system sensor histidine kinase UhpB [Pseudoduganella flava]